jgi:hypothetical protein
MYQCVLCEDWFHDTCIGNVPPADEWDDYICRECTAKYPFVVNVSDKRFILGVVEEDKVTQVLDHKKGLQKVDHLLDKKTLNEVENGKRKTEDDSQSNTGKKSKLEDGSATIHDSSYSTTNTQNEKHGRPQLICLHTQLLTDFPNLQLINFHAILICSYDTVGVKVSADAIK